MTIYDLLMVRRADGGRFEIWDLRFANGEDGGQRAEGGEQRTEGFAIGEKLSKAF